MSLYKGSCLCGCVRYEIRGELGTGYYCHCARCRKAGGSEFAANALVAADRFHVIEGEALIKTFSTGAGVHRLFCGACGSPLISRKDGVPEVVRVRLGTLDTPFPIGPSCHIHVGSRAPWSHIRDDLPQFQDMGPATPVKPKSATD